MRETGWSLEYIDGLDLGDLLEGLTVLQTHDRAVREREVAQQNAAAAHARFKVGRR